MGRPLPQQALRPRLTHRRRFVPDGPRGFSDQLSSHKLTSYRQKGRDPMRDEGEHAIFFYSRHPITAEIILSKLRAARGNLDGLLPEDLYPHDQDHYGGLEANDVLAAAAGIEQGGRVADFCAGLGGPARYFARRYGALVTGVELTPARVRGANELTRLVGLERQVQIVEGNVMAAPIPNRSVDVVISQE